MWICKKCGRLFHAHKHHDFIADYVNWLKEKEPQATNEIKIFELVDEYLPWEMEDILSMGEE